jgi:hypothetical protein
MWTDKEADRRKDVTLIDACSDYAKTTTDNKVLKDVLRLSQHVLLI